MINRDQTARTHLEKRKENINSTPSLLCKADKFLKFTFLGMSWGYHFIIVVNRSTVFKKKLNRNYKGHFKLTPDCKCICTHDGLIWDLNRAEGLTPIIDSTDTREDLLISGRYLCVRFTPKRICSLWLLSPAETGPQNITLNDGSTVHLQQRVVDHQLKLLPQH